MYKAYYSHFLKSTQGKLYLTAHSHHFWPDVTLKAQEQYWLDSARLVDEKWSYFFETVIPETQQLIAKELNVTYPGQITFAPNTHEFVNRLYSCLAPKVKVLSSDSEFYSFVRQTMRLQEEGDVVWTQISSTPFESFSDRLIQKIESEPFDMIFLSRVFFNSGFVFSDFSKLLNAVEKFQNSNCLVVIDDYHGFLAIPFDFKPFEHRFFYLSGSYKYASGGEGCCFLISPKGNTLRPRNTGWFASFETLSQFSQYDQTPYSPNGYRFNGATMDFTALYRLRAALNWLAAEGISTDKIHRYVQSLQNTFLEILHSKGIFDLKKEDLIVFDLNHHGHFLTFELKNEKQTQDLHFRLKQNHIYTDYRKNRLRFGFGLYHDHQDLHRFFGAL